MEGGLGEALRSPKEEAVGLSSRHDVAVTGAGPTATAGGGCAAGLAAEEAKEEVGAAAASV